VSTKLGLFVYTIGTTKTVRYTEWGVCCSGVSNEVGRRTVITAKILG